MKKPRISLRDAKTIVRLVSSLESISCSSQIYFLNLRNSTCSFIPGQYGPSATAECTYLGKGIPGTQVLIKTSWGKNVSTVVNPDSSWVASLLTPKPAAPSKSPYGMETM